MRCSAASVEGGRQLAFRAGGVEQRNERTPLEVAPEVEDLPHPKEDEGREREEEEVADTVVR